MYRIWCKILYRLNIIKYLTLRTIFEAKLWKITKYVLGSTIVTVLKYLWQKFWTIMCMIVLGHLNFFWAE